MKNAHVDTLLFTAWSKGVLPCITDPEATVTDRACDLIIAEIFDPIAKLASRAYDPSERVYQLLKTLDAEGVEFLQRALTTVTKKGQLNSQALIKGLESILTNCKDRNPMEWPIEMWPFVEEMCA